MSCNYQLINPRPDNIINNLLKNRKIPNICVYRCSNQDFIVGYDFNNESSYWFIVVSDLLMNNLCIDEIEWIVLHEVAHICFKDKPTIATTPDIEKRADLWAANQQKTKRWGISALHKIPSLLGKTIYDTRHLQILHEGEHPFRFIDYINALDNSLPYLL